MALSVSTSPELSTLKFSDQGTLILSSSETRRGNSAINNYDVFQIFPTQALSNAKVSVDSYGGFWSRTYINASPDWSGGTPLYVSGISGQTGDLTKWSNSAGTTLAKIASDGSLTVNGANINYRGDIFSPFNITATYALLAGKSSQSGTYNTFLTSWSQGAATLIVGGAASQTADLQQWQDSAGTVLAKVTSSGSFTSYNTNFFGRTFFLQDGSTNASTQASGAYFAASSANSAIYARTTSASIVPLVVQGTTSQTADLQQWQDSTGNKLAKIIPNGSLVFGNGSSGAGFTTIHFDQVTNSINTPDGITWNFVTTNARSAQILAVRTAASYATDLYFATANPADQYASEKMRIGSTGTVTINGFTSSNVGLIIKAAASQTANLFEIQSDSGTPMFLVNGGSFSGSGSVSVGNTGLAGSSFGSQLYVQNNNVARIGQVIKAAASQTANLQEWQNSAGTILGQVDSNGNLNFLSKIVYANQLYLGTGNYLAATMHNVSGGAGEMRLLLRAHGSQTASIQEWQNNSGTALAKVDANGNFSAISKSFDIPHPTKENMRLRYASLEGPENGVYIRGTAESNIIELPEYWTGLVHEDSITVSLTAIGSAQNIYVEKIEDNKVYIGGELTKAFFTVYGERKDIDKLTVEY